MSDEIAPNLRKLTPWLFQTVDSKHCQLLNISYTIIIRGYWGYAVGTRVLNHLFSKTICCYLCLFIACFQLVPSTAEASFISIAQKTIEDSYGGASDVMQSDLKKLADDRHQEEIAAYPNLEQKMRGQELLMIAAAAVLIALIITFPDEFAALLSSQSY